METFPPIFGVVPFEGVGSGAALALFGFYLVAFFVKGAIGFGNLSMIILFGALVLPPHHAILLAASATAISQVQFAPAAFRDGDWRITRPVLIWYFAASALGIYIFGKLSGSWLQVALGMALGLVLVADMIDLVAKLARRHDLRAPCILYPFSAASGLISGITGGGGMFFIALYVKQFSPDPRTFRGTILQLGLILTLWRISLLMIGGFITPTILLETVSLLPFIFLGGVIGTRFYRRLPVKRFYQIFQLVLLFAAVNLIWTGLRGSP